MLFLEVTLRHLDREQFAFNAPGDPRGKHRDPGIPKGSGRPKYPGPSLSPSIDVQPHILADLEREEEI